MYYLKQEVIGAEEEKVFLGKHFSEIDIPPPIQDGEVPCAWWDEDADRSLLIGTHKHGKCNPPPPKRKDHKERKKSAKNLILGRK